MADYGRNIAAKQKTALFCLYIQGRKYPLKVGNSRGTGYVYNRQ